MMRRAIAVLILVSFNLLSVARAAPPPPDDATERARLLFRAAETDFTLGRFQAALDNYSKAYEAKPLPGFLFNIGQCHMELENYERAIFFYEQYLRGDIDPKKRALVNSRLELARVKQAQGEAAAERQRREDDAREQAELAARAQEQARIVAQEQARLGAQEQARQQMAADAQAALHVTQEQAPEPVYTKWWFWTAAAVVVAGAVVTVVAVSHKGDTQNVPGGSLQTIDARNP